MMNATNKQFTKQTLSTQSSSSSSSSQKTTQITSQQAPNKLKTGSIQNALSFSNSRSQPQSLPIHHSNGTIMQQPQQQHHHHHQQQQHHNSQHSNSNNVKFIGFHTEKIDEREKYLTAKYPNHQMALIKKRLKVEFWIDDRLKILYNGTEGDHDICPDDLVDNLLDMDSDNERKYYIINQLREVKQPREQILQFADELLVKLRML